MEGFAWGLEDEEVEGDWDGDWEGAGLVLRFLRSPFEGGLIELLDDVEVVFVGWSLAWGSW